MSDKTYALIVNGAVREVIYPVSDGQGGFIDAAERFTPCFVACLVEVVGEAPAIGSICKNGKFISPPSPEAAYVYKQAYKSSAMAHASEAIAALKDAEDVGLYEEGDEDKIAALRKYRVELSRVDVKDDGKVIEWPEMPK